MKKKSDVKDLEECKTLIDNLLREYNCKIEYDEEMKIVILWDQDTNEFEEIGD